MASLRDISEAIAAALDAVMGPTALGEDAVQVTSRINLAPQSPVSVDIYQGDPFRGQETAGFGNLDGEYVYTIRARTSTPDTDAAYDALEAMMDDEHDLCVAAALEADGDLNGIVSQLVVDGNTGLRIFDDPPGQMLGCSWRARVVNLTT